MPSQFVAVFLKKIHTLVGRESRSNAVPAAWSMTSGSVPPARLTDSASRRSGAQSTVVHADLQREVTHHPVSHPHQDVY